MSTKKLIIITVALLLLLGSLEVVGLRFDRSSSKDTSEASQDRRPPSRLNLYSNDAVGLDFAYPFDFKVLKNDLGDSFEGIFEAEYDRVFGTTTESNTIIASISKDDKSIKTEMEKDRNTETVRINKKTYRIEHLYYNDGSEQKIYFIALPSDKDFYLKFSITGTPANFYYLDDLIESIKWR